MKNDPTLELRFPVAGALKGISQQEPWLALDNRRRARCPSGRPSDGAVPI